MTRTESPITGSRRQVTTRPLVNAGQGSNPLIGSSQVRRGKHPPSHPPRDDPWDECPLDIPAKSYPPGMPRAARLHRASTERVVPCLRIRSDRSAHPAPDSPQGHRQDGAAGAHRTRQAAEGSLRGPHPRVRHRRVTPGRVRGDRSRGLVHPADQRGIHPPHHQNSSKMYMKLRGFVMADVRFRSRPDSSLSGERHNGHRVQLHCGWQSAGGCSVTPGPGDPFRGVPARRESGLRAAGRVALDGISPVPDDDDLGGAG